MLKGMVELADTSVGLLVVSDELWTCVGVTDLISKTHNMLEGTVRSPCGHRYIWHELSTR